MICAFIILMAISQSLTFKISGIFNFYPKRKKKETEILSPGNFLRCTKHSLLLSFPHVLTRIQLNFHVIYFRPQTGCKAYFRYVKGVTSKIITSKGQRLMPQITNHWPLTLQYNGGFFTATTQRFLGKTVTHIKVMKKGCKCFSPLSGSDGFPINYLFA